MKIDNFFAELKRRNVYKIAVAYLVVAWLLIQAASIFLPAFDAPSWVMRIFIIVLVLGFPIALVLSWAFEITPEGIKLESEVEPNKSIRRRTGRKIVGITVGFAVIAAGLMIFQLVRPKSADAPRQSEAAAGPLSAKSIAVLPFDNLSRDPDNAFFAEGVQDEILTRLAKVADLKVISRTSTQRFKSAPENLPQIAKQLGVMHILEGSVQKSNDQVRVNVQLINALTDAHLWADIYDRKLTDLFAVESDIAKTIADTLQAKLTGSEQRAMASRPTENPEAYQLYLQGRFFWNKRTAIDLQRSIEYFSRAIEKDRSYALAYAAIAQAQVLLPAYNGGAPKDWFPKAEAAAKKALSLDDTSSDAHAALAAVMSVLYFNFGDAVQEYEKAIQLNPNDVTAHHWLANDTLACLGQSARELAEVKRAQELDPLSLIINTNLGVAYLHCGRLNEAVAQLRKTIEMDGSFYYGRWNLGVALELKKKIPEAIEEIQKAVALSNDPVPMGILAHIYGTNGRKEEARKILEQLKRMRSEGYINAYPLALAYLGLEDRDEAIKWLEQGYDDRDGFAIGAIRVDPLLFSLHHDPRFEALAEKIVPAREFKGTITSK